ncbi:hypothetical protein G9P44_002647 [Scheffersomyces stipitis]|nr:hypothetical protein G9P44_002647 [Scheffersomyces stipitis]
MLSPVSDLSSDDVAMANDAAMADDDTIVDNGTVIDDVVSPVASKSADDGASADDSVEYVECAAIKTKGIFYILIIIQCVKFMNAGFAAI